VDEPALRPCRRSGLNRRSCHKSLARAHTTVALDTLSGIAKSGKQEAARVSAAAILLDRGWGKAESVHKHTGADGEGDIRITIRQIVEGRDKH
jgi:hypothetical protein